MRSLIKSKEQGGGLEDDVGRVVVCLLSLWVLSLKMKNEYRNWALSKAERNRYIHPYV